MDWTENVGSDDGCITKLKPSLAPEGSTSALMIVRSKMPGVEDLKVDIRVRKESIEKLRGEAKTLTDAVDKNRQNLQDSEECMTRAEELLNKEKYANNQMVTDRIAMEKMKQELETRLDEGGFDEENPEDMQLLASLEEEEEDLNRKLSDLLSALEVSTQRQFQLEEQLTSTRANVKNLGAVIKEAEAEIEKKVSLLERKKSILASQEAEVKILDRIAEVPVSVLAPRFVPTATEVTKSVFRLTSCPVCSLGFHYINFMPTSCGHAYHPACLMSLIARTAEPKCIECEEYFHPHWCESWGIDTTEEHKRRWEAELCLQRQRDAFVECISDLYTKTPHVLSERRKVEKKKRQRLTLKYTAAGVERSSAISSATTRVRAHVLAPNILDSEAWTDHPSCRSTIRSSLTDEREEDVSILDINVPLTRSKKGKRLSSKGNEKLTESTRKVRTRGSFYICWMWRTVEAWTSLWIGPQTRRSREITSSSPSSMSQPGTPGGRSRDRSGHTCVELGNHVQMYHFFVETLKPCHTLEVWDKAGRELFSMSAQEFVESFGQDVSKLHKFVSSRLAAQPWGITVIGNPSFTGSQRILSFSNTGYSYSTTGPVLANSPSTRVGVVEVIPGACSTAVSDSPLVSGRPSSSSLQAFKRLQSRVNDMGKDIAHVIASLKLEADEEEFAESVVDLAG
ncbi:hypothetical protein R1sor_026217 [Riccia sorocarpa]|uniref:RING-type domain-containing protein n=1 Tax=Riccia sorocarpa TaxID=122646 RepID=A0ABD3GET4_9MARC